MTVNVETKILNNFLDFTRSTINLGFSLTGLCLLPCALLIGWIRNNPNQDAQELQIGIILNFYCLEYDLSELNFLYLIFIIDVQQTQIRKFVSR